MNKKYIPKKFLTVAEQIDLLKSRNFSFSNEKIYLFKWYLKSYGYHNFVNGYNDLLFVDEQRTLNKYKGECSCENKCTHDKNLIGIFNFDRTISKYILIKILDFERILSNAISTVICESLKKDKLNDFGQFFIIDNDEQKKVFSNFFEKNNQLKIEIENKEFEKFLNSLKNNFLKNNKSKKIYKYNDFNSIPIWTLSIFWNFGTLRKVLFYLNNFLSNKIIWILNAKNNNKLFKNKKELMDLLKCLNVIRNICCHNNVIYNYSYKWLGSVKEFMINNGLEKVREIKIFDVVKILDLILNTKKNDNALEVLFQRKIDSWTKDICLEIKDLLKKKINYK